ncbi:MAG: hypothetical protein AW09_003497 [Candidatus Accumulibacter phosphatis]|uniref:Uncharacterized protein n=1 Tax=Candidatus Accumulibacter phosphatis TaxID=327160 RepID=A0A080LSJ2_9PROT|nr:MAG: hypothetical protein AW09_003497 [Candidatus Accumulibacter phosphatis]
MGFALDVVVVAVYGFDAGAERLGDYATRSGNHILHHQQTVAPRKILCPTDGFDVIIEVLAALCEVGEVTIRQLGDVLLHVLLCQPDEVVTDGIADAA